MAALMIYYNDYNKLMIIQYDVIIMYDVTIYDVIVMIIIFNSQLFACLDGHKLKMGSKIAVH